MARGFRVWARLSAQAAAVFLLARNLIQPSFAGDATAVTPGAAAASPMTAEDDLYDIGSPDLSDLGPWIWASKTFDAQTCRFWKSFEVPKSSAIVVARLRITADNEYTVFLDGNEVGRGAEWRHLYGYNVAQLLKPGKHVLAVEAYNSTREAGLIVGLRVGLADGRTVEVKTDQSWRVVPNDVAGWEKKLKASDDWPPATIIAACGQPPWWAKPWNIDAMIPEKPVLVHFWQTGWFQITLLVVCLMVVFISFRLMAQISLHNKEQRLLQRERARIARDIHDDLGTRMTQLILQGEVAQSKQPPGSETRAQFARMSEDAREVLRAMHEVLWAINPQRDTLQGFATFVCGYTQGFLRATPMQCLLEVEPGISAVAFDLPLRRNLLLAVKEALNNAVKHSGATELLLEIKRQGQGLIAAVQDNGKGFDPGQSDPERNGLLNMTQRMKEVGGSCRVLSSPGKGCRVEFTVPLTSTSRGWWLKLARRDETQSGGAFGDSSPAAAADISDSAKS